MLKGIPSNLVCLKNSCGYYQKSLDQKITYREFTNLYEYTNKYGA
jgi:hypothetical protein